METAYFSDENDVFVLDWLGQIYFLDLNEEEVQSARIGKRTYDLEVLGASPSTRLDEEVARLRAAPHKMDRNVHRVTLDRDGLAGTLSFDETEGLFNLSGAPFGRFLCCLLPDVLPARVADGGRAALIPLDPNRDLETDRGVSFTHVVDNVTGRTYPLPTEMRRALEARTVETAAYDSSTDTLAMRYRSHNDVRKPVIHLSRQDNVLVEIPCGDSKEPRRGAFRPLQFERATAIWQGHSVPLSVFAEVGASETGIIVFFHGGPVSTSYYDDNSMIIDHYTGKGYTVIVPDYAGSSGVEFRGRDALEELGTEAVEQDMRALLKYLQENYNSNADTILVANSYGAVYVSVLNRLGIDHEFDGFVLYAPWLNPESTVPDDCGPSSFVYGANQRDAILCAAFGSDSQGRHVATNLSMANANLCTLNAPILAFFGTHDNVSRSDDLGPCLDQTTIMEVRSSHGFVIPKVLYEGHRTIPRQ